MDVTKSVQAGRMAPAAFQRPYVWSKDDVVALFASISKGWPIGTLLVWEPEDANVVGRGRLGPLPMIDASSQPAIILDGQNRLASIAWALGTSIDDDIPSLDYSDAEIETWMSGEILIADAARRCFRFAPSSESRTSTTLPAGLLVGSGSALNQAFRSSKDMGDVAMSWFDRMADTVRETRIMSTTISDATPGEAREAFLHICRTGVPMSEEDFEMALNWQPEMPVSPKAFRP